MRELFSVNGRHFSVNGRHFSVKGRHFSVKGRHFSVNGRHFSVNGRHFSVKGRHFSVNGRHFSVKGRHFSVNGRHFSLKGSRLCVNGSKPAYLPHAIMETDRATTEAISILRNVLASPTIIRSIANSVESNVSPSAQLQSESELRTLFRPSAPGVQSINNRPTTSSAGEVHGPRYQTRQQYGNWQSRSRKR